MKISRRDLSWLVPAVATASEAAAPELPQIKSSVFGDSSIPYKGDEKKKGRRFFDQITRQGFEIEVHETILSPGVAAHPPHQHEHEEIIVVLEGSVTIHVEGGSQLAPAGSVITYASNQMHNLHNSGISSARYYVIELRGNKNR